MLYVDAALERLPTLTTPSGLSLFSVSSALHLLLPVPKESEILNDRWLEWEISQLQVRRCNSIQTCFLFTVASSFCFL